MDISISMIVQILILVAIIGGIVWAAERYLPIPPPFKGILMFVLIVLGLLLIGSRLGVLAAPAHGASICTDPYVLDVLGQCVCPNPADPRLEPAPKNVAYVPPNIGWIPEYPGAPDLPGDSLEAPCQFALPHGPREVGLSPDGQGDRVF